MKRVFNTTGPCDPEFHYTLSPEARLPELLGLVERRQCFVVHAARQTGKTTAIRAFATRLLSLGYVAVWATLEACQGVTATEDAEPLWLGAIERSARFLPEALRPPSRVPFLQGVPGERLGSWLEAWAQRLPGSAIVLFLDEADVVSESLAGCATHPHCVVGMVHENPHNPQRWLRCSCTIPPGTPGARSAFCKRLTEPPAELVERFDDASAFCPHP